MGRGCRSGGGTPAAGHDHLTVAAADPPGKGPRRWPRRLATVFAGILLALIVGPYPVPLPANSDEGAAASLYFDGHPATIDGLVLWASYSSADISTTASSS